MFHNLPLVRSFICCVLLVAALSISAQSSLAPSLQVHTSYAQFWPKNYFENEVHYFNHNFRKINSWAVGLAFQKPLRPKWALQASWYYLQGEETFKESFWQRYPAYGNSGNDLKSSAPHSLQMTYLNLQVYAQQHGLNQETFELGLGFVGALNQQHYRSSFEFNEQIRQLEKEEYTTQRDLDFGLSIGMRFSIMLRERWRMGLEAGGIFFFDGDLLLNLALSTHYRLRP